MPSSVETEERSIKIGILEVQGAFLEHKNALLKAKEQIKLPVQIETFEVRNPSHVTSDLDGMIIPGGESTTISLFLKRNNMIEPLHDWIQNRKHVTWGTCAGMIILARQNENQKIGGQPMLDVMDTDVSRNYFGRQVNSFEAEVNLSDSFTQVCPGDKTYHGVFIRAPAVVQTLSPKVEVLATFTQKEKAEDVIVAVQQENIIATAFHPELTEDVRWHQFFIKRLLANKTAP
ncbi:pyridoxal 5'-phosphate synthase subunit PdxT-like [Saccostrea cucullata]|uniref:pyridoxal 5'-phosphate synthase subunit PdxT-like n=1 Tax=Saccostrea cuccullata TaxID=36930 RepID=UPI002ED647C0